METYKASTPDAEVIGQALLAYKASNERDTYEHILDEYDLTEIDPETWYPQQLTLDIQKAIKEKSGNALALVSIGMKIIDTAAFPPMDSLEDALEAFAASYPMNFRNQADDDVIEAHLIEDGYAQVINRSPHSDAMVYGYVYALVRRFLPDGTHFTVKYDDPADIDTYKDMVFHIRW